MAVLRKDSHHGVIFSVWYVNVGLTVMLSKRLTVFIFYSAVAKVLKKFPM